MTLLEESRAKIDAVDKQMAQLFEQRMEAVAGVVEYKLKTGMAVLDSGREQQVVQKNSAYINNEELKPYYVQFLKQEMAVSRQYQNKVLGRNRVAYQGVAGAWAHQALEKLYPQAEAIPCDTWAQVFEAVQSNRAAMGVLPFENSSAGDVSTVLDLCYAHPGLNVIGSIDLPISQDLLVLPGTKLSEVRTVVSHPQALSQCGSFLLGNGFATREWANTAMAAKLVADTGDKTLAAIASSKTAALYGLEVLCPHINNDADNTTRFIVISKQRAHSGDRFSLLFTLEHKPGTLAKAILAIGAAGFNMECIKSRPMPGVPFEYYFYVELVGDAAGDACADMMDKLDEVCTSVRVLGVFTREKEAREEL